MSNVDYVIVGPGPALRDVLNLAETAMGSAEIVDDCVLITGDDRTSVSVYTSPRGGTVADVYYGGDIADRRAISQRIFDYIVEHTDWDVELDSDDADGIIASRTKANA